MITLIKAIPPSFEEGYCPSNWTEFALKLFSEAQFIFQSDVANSFYNIGDGIPPVDQRAFPWIRTIGGQLDRLYVWSPNYGAWTAPYWPTPDSKFVLDWTGNETDLKQLDNPGGAAVAVTPTTGPFWEVDHDFDARIAIGSGTLPLSSVLIGVGTNGGADQIGLSASHLPKHRHSISMFDNQSDSFLADEPLEQGGFRVRGAAEDLQFRATPDSGASGLVVGRTRESGSDTSLPENKLSIMPPYRGVLKARRTLRKYYAVA